MSGEQFKRTNMKPKCVILSARGVKSFTAAQAKEIIARLDAVFIEVLEPLNKKDFIKRVYDANILAVTRRSIKDFDRNIIDALPNLKALVVYSTGYEWLDLDYLKEKGVLVSFLPDYCTASVAEHTLTMILTMMRRTHLSYDKARGLIPQDVSLRGFELRGKDVGIIGLGRIGREIALLLKALGTNVSYYDVREIRDAAVPFMPVEDMLKRSDIVVLACSKTRGAPPIIGAMEIALLKNGAFLINPARSDLVETQAIVDALKEKRLMGYAVDDTIGDFNDVLDFGRIFQTGHTAWYSTEAIERGTDMWVKNIIALADGTISPMNLL